MRRNGGYYFYVFILIAVIAIGAFAWNRCEERIVEKYVEESGRVLLTEEELEEIKSESYEEGYADGQDGSEYAADNAVTWATVYYTDYGECYHTNPSCVSLRGHDNIHETSLENLYKNGSDLRPCDICVPHSDD